MKPKRELEDWAIIGVSVFLGIQATIFLAAQIALLVKGLFG